MSARSAAVCWLAAGIAYPSLEAVAASAVGGYRYAHDFISDLGRPDSPLSYAMNTAFVVQGTMFATGALLLIRAVEPRHGRLLAGCAAANVVGNVVIAAVPSGPSSLAWLHVTGAVLAIVGGNAAIMVGWPAVGASRTYGAASIGLTTLGLTSFGLLAVASATGTPAVLPSAVWERTSVYTIIGWQVLSAIVLLTRRRR